MFKGKLNECTNVHFFLFQIPKLIFYDGRTTLKCFGFASSFVKIIYLPKFIFIKTFLKRTFTFLMRNSAILKCNNRVLKRNSAILKCKNTILKRCFKVLKCNNTILKRCFAVVKFNYTILMRCFTILKCKNAILKRINRIFMCNYVILMRSYVILGLYFKKFMQWAYKIIFVKFHNPVTFGWNKCSV